MRASNAAAAAVGYLLVQAVVGYEWLSSGLTKIVHGDFPGGLADDLRERESQSAAWYRHFLDRAIIPHAATFGYAIEAVELAAGIVLIASAVVLLARPRFPSVPMRGVAAVTALAALAGLVIVVNLVLADRVGFRPVGPDSFDEAITLDALLVGVQSILLGVSLFVAARTPQREP